MEDRLAVRRALLALPLEQRAAVTLCLVSGFSLRRPQRFSARRWAP
jgi:DNA-directed RNA polymerase specialized sigma24 family protein